MSFIISSAAPCLAIDACCSINIYASGKLQSIIGSLPFPVHVTDEITNEVKGFSMTSLFEEGRIILDSFTSENECETFVNLAALSIGNGESACGTLALHRGYAVASDDKFACNILRKAKSNIEIFGTSHLIRHWSMLERVSEMYPIN